MKLLKLTTSLFVILILGFSTISCTEKKSKNISKEIEMKNNDGHDHEHSEEVESESNNMNDSEMDMQKSNRSKLLIASYLRLKNALVSDDSKEAAVEAEVMVKTFERFNASGFNTDQQKEIAEIIENASEQVEHIADNASKIDHQREHFEVLSNDMSDLIAIVGSEQTLYKTKCPMYNKGKGGIWLSETKEIRNPFYGSKMLTCGSVQKEI